VRFGINRPDSGPDHGQSHAENGQYNGDQRISRPQQHPDLDNGNRNSGEWRLEAKKEKYARDTRDQIWETTGRQSSGFQEARRREIEQNCARKYSQYQ
jgi:hypothetical protein